MKKKRKSVFTYIVIIIILLASITSLVCIGICNNNKVKVIGSESKFKRIISSNDYNPGNILKKIFTLPYSLYELGTMQTNSSSSIDSGSFTGALNKETTSSVEYSTTNLQVENVDEADIVKTDGKYIYSLTDNEVIITETFEDGNTKIVSRISNIEAPEDIFVNNDKLIVISTISSSKNTVVDIFNITDRSNPKKLKNIELKLDYYTSRLINNKLYIFSSGNISKYNLDKYYYYDNKNKKHISLYSVNDMPQKMDYNKIMYVKDINSKFLTAIIDVDLNNLDNINFNGIMMNISNAYISQNNIYVVESKYMYENRYNLGSIFGFKGVFGILGEEYYGTYTNIYKFNIQDQKIEYVDMAKEKGSTLNQFSMDEYNGNLRVALNDGTNQNKIAIYDENMKKIGGLNNIAQGEKIYSTRFINDRAYMVTYKTIDPLFVIDLSNPEQPQILGKLKIPGYSTYLHPYDENHIIGIGNDTTTKVYRNSSGKVTSESTVITGMKMAIFDVTDVSNPKEMFSQKIGDSKTYSSVLSNHKSLLFSKEKNLFAIPINNYSSDINVIKTDDNISSSDISSKIKSSRVSNGYLVYNIDLNNGFKEKGTITHNTSSNYFTYSKYSDELRGLYINNILYTISNKYIKANDIDTLSEKSCLKLEEEN